MDNRAVNEDEDKSLLVKINNKKNKGKQKDEMGINKTKKQLKEAEKIAKAAKKENENALSDHHIGNRFTASGRG